MPIVVRSVKTGMMKLGNPRSGLEGVPSPDARRRRLSRLARTPARILCDIRCFRRTKPHTAPFPFPTKYRQNCRTRHLFDDVDQHTPPPRPLIVQGISHPPQGV